jgi:hypothetical protein
MRISKHAAAAPYVEVVAQTKTALFGMSNSDMHHVYDASHKALSLAAIGIPLVTATVAGGVALYDRMTAATHKANQFKQMLVENPHLRSQNPALVQKYFNTLHTMNPTMAKDPTVAASFVNNMVQTGSDPRTPHRDIFAQALQMQTAQAKMPTKSNPLTSAAKDFSSALKDTSDLAENLAYPRHRPTPP